MCALSLHSKHFFQWKSGCDFLLGNGIWNTLLPPSVGRIGPSVWHIRDFRPPEWPKIGVDIFPFLGRLGGGGGIAAAIPPVEYRAWGKGE